MPRSPISVPGDVWYFPKGHGHSIQGLGPQECHFLLVFDDGRFSEFGTFSITDWLARTPPDVLAQNLSLPPEVLAKLPKEEVYIVQGEVPPAVGARSAQSESRTEPAQSQVPSRCGAGHAIRRWHRTARLAAAVSDLVDDHRRAADASNPGDCASCTGIPTPTNGSTISPAARRSASSARTESTVKTSSVRATSPSSIAASATTSGRSATSRREFWWPSIAPTIRRSRSRRGWHPIRADCSPIISDST